MAGLCTRWKFSRSLFKVVQNALSLHPWDDSQIQMGVLHVVFRSQCTVAQKSKSNKPPHSELFKAITALDSSDDSQDSYVRQCPAQQELRMISANSNIDVEIMCKFFEQNTWGPKMEKELKHLNFYLTSPKVIAVLSKLKDARTGFSFFIWAGEQRGYCYDTRALETMKDLFRSVANIKEIGNLLTDMKNDGRYLPVEAFIVLMNVYAEKNMVNHALDIFSSMKATYDQRPNVEAYNNILRILGNADHIEQVKDIYQQMRHDRCCFPDNFTFKILLNAYGKAGKVEEAREVLKEMEKNNETLEVGNYTSLINGLCQGGFMDEALEIQTGILYNGVEPDITTYGALISGYARAGNMVEAKRFFNEIVRDRALSLKEDIYFSLIDGFCNANEMGEACKLLKELVERGFDLNVGVYNSLIAAASKNSLDNALKFFDDMIDRGIHPNVESYNALITAAYKEGRMENAFRLFQDMGGADCQATAVTYRTLFIGLCKADKVVEALDIFGIIGKSKPPDGVAYKAVLKAVCEECEEVVMKKVIRALVEAGKLDRALAVMKIQCCFEADLYAKLIVALCQSNKVFVGQKLWNEMLNQGCEAPIAAYNALLSGLCQEGEVHMACKIMEDLKCHGLSPDVDVYNILLSNLGKSGDTGKASELYQEMTEKRSYPGDVAYSLLSSTTVNEKSTNDQEHFDNTALKNT